MWGSSWTLSSVICMVMCVRWRGERVCVSYRSTIEMWRCVQMWFPRFQVNGLRRSQTQELKPTKLNHFLQEGADESYKCGSAILSAWTDVLPFDPERSLAPFVFFKLQPLTQVAPTLIIVWNKYWKTLFHLNTVFRCGCWFLAHGLFCCFLRSLLDAWAIYWS